MHHICIYNVYVNIFVFYFPPFVFWFCSFFYIILGGLTLFSNAHIHNIIPETFIVSCVGVEQFRHGNVSLFYLKVLLSSSKPSAIPWLGQAHSSGNKKRQTKQFSNVRSCPAELAFLICMCVVWLQAVGTTHASCTSKCCVYVNDGCDDIFTLTTQSPSILHHGVLISKQCYTAVVMRWMWLELQNQQALTSRL